MEPNPDAPAYGSGNGVLTIRAEIASRALAGLLSNPSVHEADCTIDEIACEALQYTDALIARLNDE